MNDSIKIETFAHPTASIVIAGDAGIPASYNTGNMLLRNTAFTRRLLDDLVAMHSGLDALPDEGARFIDEWKDTMGNWCHDRVAHIAAQSTCQQAAGGNLTSRTLRACLERVHLPTPLPPPHRAPAVAPAD